MRAPPGSVPLTPVFLCASFVIKLRIMLCLLGMRLNLLNYWVRAFLDFSVFEQSENLMHKGADFCFLVVR